MHYVMSGLARVNLQAGDSIGGVGTWIDDIAFHADTFEGVV